VSQPSSSDPDTSTRTAPIRPRVVLEPIAKEQAAVLQNLFELYVHDFSEQVPLALEATGRFEVSPGDRWWTDGHYPFFIRCDEKLCGFALVRRGSRFTGAMDVMDVAEFFVVRGARRKRVGATVAHALFTAFAGGWEIRVRRSNPAALEFWSRATEEWVGRPVARAHVSFEGVDWNVLRIEPQERGVGGRASRL
jgi:predicted acetyltransferase